MLHLIFDIDKTLLTKNRTGTLNFFQDASKGLPDEDRYRRLKNQVMFEGVPEIFMWLRDIPNITVSSISNGIHSRNSIFFEQAMIRRSDEEIGRQLTLKINIISWGDPRRVLPDKETKKDTYECHKKDIRLFVYPKNNFEFHPFELDQTVEETVIQEEKILNDAYAEIANDSIDYEEELKNTILIDDSKEVIVTGYEKHLLLCPTQGHTTKAFRTLSSFTGSDQEFKESELYAKVNNVLYIAGFLFYALHRAQIRELPLSKVITELQRNNEFTQQQFVDTGYALLKQYNPNLKLITPSFVKSYDDDDDDDLSVVDGGVLENLFSENTNAP